MHAPVPRPRSSVLVLMGGPDAERAVSLQSGREVAAALRRSGRFEVLERVIDRPGVPELREMGGDVIFPVLHGQWGEGGGLQELLERLDVGYVGSRPRAASLAMDKLATKMVLSSFDVVTPPARELLPDAECDLEPPLVLKPVDDGSSVDLAVCHDRAAVDEARARLHPRRGRLMAERYIAGRELTVGIVCDEPLPIIEIVPAEGLYDYDAKYERQDTRYLVNPALPDGIAARCWDVAMLAYDRLGCRDIARVDFMLDDRDLWFLEINTMPGFTTHSLVPMAAESVGVPMPRLCDELVATALDRHERARRDGEARRVFGAPRPI